MIIVSNYIRRNTRGSQIVFIELFSQSSLTRKNTTTVTQYSRTVRYNKWNNYSRLYLNDPRITGEFSFFCTTEPFWSSILRQSQKKPTRVFPKTPLNLLFSFVLFWKAKWRLMINEVKVWSVLFCRRGWELHLNYKSTTILVRIQNARSKALGSYIQIKLLYWQSKSIWNHKSSCIHHRDQNWPTSFSTGTASFTVHSNESKTPSCAL